MKKRFHVPASDSARPAPLTSRKAAAALSAGLLALILAGCAGAPLRLPGLSTGTADDEPPGATTAAAEPQPERKDEPEPIPAPQEKAKPGQLYDWSANGRGVTRIIIDTDEQRARFYSGGEQIGWTTVATGLGSHPTPTGHFEVLEKVQDKRSNLYGRIYNSGGGLVRGNAKAGQDRVPPGGRFVGASMPHFLRLTYDGIGMHAGPIPRPGRPASHGCIRMPARIASALYTEVSVGTPVTIVGNGPDYGNYAAKVRRERAAAEARRNALAEGGSPIDALDAEIAATQALPQPVPPQPPAQAADADRTESEAGTADPKPGESDDTTAPPADDMDMSTPHGPPPRPPQIRSAARFAPLPDQV
jgi:lipoprotein-anchoring transpeptidase ErfK/SrfK